MLDITVHNVVNGTVIPFRTQMEVLVLLMALVLHLIIVSATQTGLVTCVKYQYVMGYLEIVQLFATT